MKQKIMFDLDDTLIHCNKYFNFIIEQFIDEMSTWYGPAGITSAEISSKQTEIDIARVHVQGFKSEHFPQSFIDTYRYYQQMTGRPSSPLEEEKLWRLGLSVYEQEVEPYPMMEDTLDRLASSGHELHLYTGGDALVQHRKIERVQLERYFQNRIYVRQHKNTEALEQILIEGQFERESTWMIGNSVRTDVLPALQCGINAVYLKQESEWKYNIIPINEPPKGALLTLTTLPQVPPAIHDYLDSLDMREPG